MQAVIKHRQTHSVLDK